METVAIFGVGLIGGSFALAIRKAGFSGRILGVSSAATTSRALELGVIDEAVSGKQAASHADLIYLSQPIGQILETFTWIEDYVRADALITDAGSTKGSIVAEAGNHIRRCQFLGGHPMAGKETRGVESADAGLFQGRPYLLTPVKRDDLTTPVASGFIEWIQHIGANPIILDPGEHDRLVALASHLPQLLSTALAAYLDQREPALRSIAGPALTDITRLALSPFDVWSDIFTTNLVAVDRALADYIVALTELRSLLVDSSLREKFESANHFARELRTVN
jgi:prephenate dehydrogenase